MAPTKSPRKTVSKSPRLKTAHSGTRKKAPTSSLLKSLPESVEHIEIVQQVACVLEELQKRVLDVKAEASKELKKLMKLYENNYKGLEKKVHQVTSEAKKQAQTSMIQLLQKWHEHKEKLPAPLAKEIERIIAQIGSKVVARRSSPKKASAAKPRSAKTAAAKRKTPSMKSSAKSIAVPKRRVKASTAAVPKVVPTAPIEE